jgi:hypothetical protein
VTSRSKTCLWMGVVEPNEARMIEARAGWEEVRNWNGRSFWVCRKQMLAACYLFG